MPVATPELVHEAFRKALPYELAPTNLPGVFVSNAPPVGFDPNTADRKDLIRYGLLWDRPGPAADPAVRAAWDRVFSRKWDPKKRIVPKMKVKYAKTDQIQPLIKPEIGYASHSWSGAGLQGAPGSFTSVVGSWTIPWIIPSSEQEGYDYYGWRLWSGVGLDGFANSSEFLMVGIDEWIYDFMGGDLYGTGYAAFYEWYVKGADSNKTPYVSPIYVPNFPVAPGHIVNASVQYVNNNTAGKIDFANETTGQHFSITLAPPDGATCSGSRAEWILGTPDGGEPACSLPDFAPVQFTGAMACHDYSSIQNPQNGDYMNIVVDGRTLTNVTLGNYAVTINFTGHAWGE